MQKGQMECAGILRDSCQQDGSAFPLQRQDADRHGRDEPRTGDQGHMPCVFRYCIVVYFRLMHGNAKLCATIVHITSMYIYAIYVYCIICCIYVYIIYCNVYIIYIAVHPVQNVIGFCSDNCSVMKGCHNSLFLRGCGRCNLPSSTLTVFAISQTCAATSFWMTS